MSYLTPINHTSPARAADDFQCGWSVMRMLAELSLQGRDAPTDAPAPKTRAPRRSARPAQPGPELA